MSTRLCSSGIARSKLRRPASIWATGIAELHRRERAGQRRVDVARRRRRGRARARAGPARCRRGLARSARACVPEPTPRKTSGRGIPSSPKKTSDIAVVVVLPRVDEHELERGSSAASARRPAPTFMKFGRAPTTKQTRADTRGILPSALHSAETPRVQSRRRQPPPGGCATVSTRPVLVLKLLFWLSLGALVWTHVAYPLAACGARARPHAARAQGGDRAARDGDRRRLQRGAGDRAAAREPARARLPGRQARGRRHLRRVDRPHARARRAASETACG